MSSDQLLLQRMDGWINRTKDAEAEIAHLREAVQTHYNQRVDDLCWMDHNKLYDAFGLPPKDYHIGDPRAMLRNCKRFIRNECQAGGEWKSYVGLEEEIKQLKEQKADDEIKTTAEWLNENIEWHEEGDVKYSGFRVMWYKNLSIRIGSDWEHAWYLNCVQIKAPKTRGEARRLFAALSIPWKEQKCKT